MLNNKNQKLFTLSARGICCGLLATGLLIQTGTYQAYAATSGHNNYRNALASLSDSELQTLHERICSLWAYTQAEDEDILINEHEITLDVGDTFKLELKRTNGEAVHGVEWFVKTRIPYDELFTAESYNLQDGACSITSDGLVTAKKAGTTEYWAKYGDALYRCVVVVNKEGETALSKKVVEIADKFRHLSDVDKVMAVHDYLIDHIEYSNPHIRSFAYGALIEGKAVCQGYAQSLAMILNNLNVECHTIVAMTKGSNPVLHEWVRVKLDGEWYYIDLTWDDTPWAEDKNYKYFLINTDMISRDHETGYSLAGGPEVDGSKYLYYAYKKQGIFAETKDDIDKIIRDQINATNQSYTTVKIAAPASVPDYEIHGAIRRIAGSQATLKELNDIKNTSGSFHHYGFNVGFIKAVPSVNAELTGIRPINAAGGTTTGLELTFSGDIGELTPFNVKISDAHITDIKKTGAGIYELTFGELLSRNDTDLTVSVSKRGYNISNSEKTVHISVAKEATPDVGFEATGLKEGRLVNVEPGLKYSVGDGIWHDITSTSPVDVTTIYKTPISVVRKSTGEGRLDSEAQFIRPINTREPMNLRAVNCSANNNDGKILYLNRQMEYQKSGDSTWVSSPGKEVTGLSSGEYKVRYKASGLNLASSEVTVTVNAGPASTDVQRPYTPIFRPGVNAGTGSPTGENSGSVGGSSAGEVGGSSGGDFAGGGASSGGFTGGGFAGGGFVGGGFAGGGFAGGGFAGGDASSGGFAGGGFAGGGFAGGADTEADSKKADVSKSDDAGAKEAESKDNKASSTEGTDVISISKKVASFSKSDLSDIVKSGVKALNITDNKVRLSFETKAIKAISKQTEEDIKIKVTGNNTVGLSSKAKKLIGVHPVYDISISGKDGTKITNLGKGYVTVSIPYKLSKSEKAENVIIYYIDKKGNVKKVSKAVYDSKTKTITFATGRLTRFAVGYRKK
ncbi:MAG: hypothetical protein HXK79_00365 [Lachnospiraceae bacterium]|nr:hypothetical protein [Lachnospiraceae bacterium]